MSMAPVIHLQQVSKRYGAEVALDRVSLEVPPGVVFALLGENGAGKTTAIRILLGLTEPDSGEAHVLGLPSATAGTEIRRQVGYVPERLTLYEWMTVAEIGWFTAAFYGDEFLPGYDRLIRQYALPPRRKIKALSKGMRAKVALALATAHQPKVLILDEPTSGLDALVRREFLESMVDRAAAGQTVLLSSHQIAEVERVADFVAILRGGELLLVQKLDELKAQIRELTFTLVNGQVKPPALPGEILTERQRARQWQVMVRGVAEERLGELSSHPAVRELQCRVPNLEEIFVAYMEHGRPAGQTPSAEEVSAS
jgi:ABC-2 type transport system ATP-binding protein